MSSSNSNNSFNNTSYQQDKIGLRQNSRINQFDNYNFKKPQQQRPKTTTYYGQQNNSVFPTFSSQNNNNNNNVNTKLSSSLEDYDLSLTSTQNSTLTPTTNYPQRNYQKRNINNNFSSIQKF